jgi:SAM-dependent methyltransferase
MQSQIGAFLALEGSAGRLRAHQGCEQSTSARVRIAVSLLGDIVKNTALAVPWIRKKRAQESLRAGCGRSARKNTPSYERGVFEQHRAAVERYRPIGGKVLEIGPGANLAQAALFMQAGADEAVCIDAMPWVEEVQSLYDALGIDDEVLARVRYECPCAVETAGFPDESFDIIVSQACYQLFRDPGAATRNIARMLRSGGITTHQIDFRDKRDFSKPLEFLKIGGRAWRLAMSRRQPTNRWRASDILRVFREAGLIVLDTVVTERTEVTKEMAESFAPPFRAYALDDLSILGLFLAAAKPPVASNSLPPPRSPPPSSP